MAPPLWPILMEIEVSRYASDVQYLILTMHSDGLFKRYVIAPFYTAAARKVTTYYI
jgi:hypothetical protein